MRFWCDGHVYDTRRLTAYETGDDSTPVIYVTEDLHGVFVKTTDRVGVAEIHRADMLETVCLAGRYCIDALLKTFPAAAMGADVEADAADQFEGESAGLAFG